MEREEKPVRTDSIEPHGQGGRRRYLPRPAARRVVLGAALLVTVSSVGFSSSPPGSASPRTDLARGKPGASLASLQWALPVSPVGRQLGWLVGAASRPPIPASEIRAHFDATFLGQVSPQALNRVLAGLQVVGEWRIVTLDAGTSPGGLAANVVEGSTRVGVEISVDGQGLISGLFLQPATALPSPPKSWKQLDAELSALAPDVGLEAATVSASGRCTPVHALFGSTARPLGSMFKLFVLGAVARAVRAGTLSWGETVALDRKLMSLPSGVLQVDPPGTKYSVAQYAQVMISSSDNTAADRLAALVGRDAVEAQVRRWSGHAALDTPFLRTRELFVLKYADYPRYADAYLALPAKARAGYLERVVDGIPLSAVGASPADLATPRKIDEIEWFASPADLCHAFAGLFGQAGGSPSSPVSAAMSLNDGGLGLGRATWPLVWFKGGSEQGVLTLGYLARNRSGRVVVVVALLSNPHQSLDESAVAPRLLSIMRGAFQMAG